MISPLELILGLMAVVAGLAVVARRLRLPYPILFVVGGLGLGFAPGLPTIHFDPSLIFVLFLPPLLYPAAIFTPWRDFRENLGPILRLAIGLVLLTTVAVAWFVHRWVGMPWAAGFVLGAIISPPDAVAATAITQGLRVPRVIVTILDGESLVNDATSFTAYRFAVAAAVTGAFSLAAASTEFVVAVLGGIVVGLAGGWVFGWIQKRLDDPPVQTTLSLLAPYVIYVVADRIHVSGVLAVVIAGLYAGWKGPEILTSRMRLLATATWTMVVFILNGFLFVLIGLQLPEVVHGLVGISLRQAIGISCLILALIVLVRILWFFTMTALMRFLHIQLPKYEGPLWRHLLLLSWAGMRGVDSLAAALALPLTTASHAPFPRRSLIVFVTFSVILGTLVLQGLSLGPMIRWLKLKGDHRLEDEERQARLRANQAAMTHLNKTRRGKRTASDTINRLRAEYEDRVQQLTGNGAEAGENGLTLYSAEYESLSLELLQEERKVILALRNDGTINDHVLRKIQLDLDLAETRLSRPKAD